MGVAFVPLYIKYLGMEAYGLIGIFAILQAWLVLLDMGMKPALGREMARFTAGAHNAQSIRDLLRSIELIGIAVAGVDRAWHLGRIGMAGRPLGDGKDTCR
jgi:O-antigen/teichoic acid export membrane protein